MFVGCPVQRVREPLVFHRLPYVVRPSPAWAAQKKLHPNNRLSQFGQTFSLGQKRDIFGTLSRIKQQCSALAPTAISSAMKLGAAYRRCIILEYFVYRPRCLSVPPGKCSPKSRSPGTNSCNPPVLLVRLRPPDIGRYYPKLAGR